MSKDVDVVFVILHYMAVNDTCECVESIFKHVDCNSFHVIIVDNCSPDESYKFLIEKYDRNEKITILHNNQNLGFSKGNNVGFAYAKKHMNAKFIVLLNNDICLFQNNFYQNIIKAYKTYHYAVLGPMIITKDGMCTSNPKAGGILTPSEVRKGLKNQKRRLLAAKFHVDYLIYDLLLPICKRLKQSFKNNKNYSGQYELRLDVKLHGSFLVFSREYIDKFAGLDSRTFLYMEEDILYLHLMKNSMRTIYDPEIAVYHKEDISTSFIVKNNRKKRLFTTSNNIESMKVYLLAYNEYENRDDI